MPHHCWDCRPLPLRQLQELRCEIAHSVAIERHIVSYPEGIKNQNNSKGSSEGSPSASACSISERACVAAALVSAAARLANRSLRESAFKGFCETGVEARA